MKIPIKNIFIFVVCANRLRFQGFTLHLLARFVMHMDNVAAVVQEYFETNERPLVRDWCQSRYKRGRNVVITGCKPSAKADTPKC